jgi:hypothetical protein
MRQYKICRQPADFNSLGFLSSDLFWPCLISHHIKWIPSDDGMARPQILDGGDSLHIWSLAANILDILQRPADNVCFPLRC